MGNQKPTTSINYQRDRLSYLWLAIGAILLPFAHFQTVWPIAAWLSPVFLMRFTRTRRLAVGLPLIVLVQCLGAAIGMRNGYGVAPVGTPASLVLAVGALLYGLPFSLPFVMDRLLTGRLPGVPRTLVYPLAAVTIDYLLALEPFHISFGSPAYTQYGDLPLMQLVSLTGMWGLTFLVSWLAPVVNEVWERGPSPRVLCYSLLPFALVLAGVLVYGSARLTFTPNVPVVRVAGLTPEHSLYLRDPNGKEIFWPPIEDIARSSDTQRAQWGAEWMKVVDDLVARSRQEAQASAKIITWADESAFILKEDEPIVLQKAEAVAREEHVYLQLGLQPILRTQQYPFAENRAVMIDPAGNVVWDYRKAYPIPFAETNEYPGGPAVVPYQDTPYGRLAGIICYDADTVPYLRQAGLASVGLLLAPANDWPAIEYDHAHIAVYRAVENGISMMRPSAKGISLAVDPLGRELAQSDYFATDRLDLIAMMPVQSLPTLYSRIGDLFAWLSMAGLVVLIGFAFTRRRKAGEAGAAEPSGAPLPVS